MLFRRAGQRVISIQRRQFSTQTAMDQITAKGLKTLPVVGLLTLYGIRALFKSPEVPAVQRAGGHGEHH